MQEITLSSDSLTLGVLPACGAAISFFKHGAADIFRPMAVSDKADANDAALFLMLPYCGRIRGGSFVYWGITRKVPKNQHGIADPIHGDGWKTPWQIAERSASHVALRMSHDKAAGYPFSYDATVVYRLDKNVFSVEMAVQNKEELPMPCGLGVHPFFPKTKDVALDFSAPAVWSNEADPIFGSPYPAPEAWSFAGGKPLKSAVFDTCFGSYDGFAKITYPARKLAVEIHSDESFRHIVLYAPKTKDFFSLEPTTCASDAFNLAAAGVIGTGIRSVGPQQKATAQVLFKIQG